MASRAAASKRGELLRCVSEARVQNHEDPRAECAASIASSPALLFTFNHHISAPFIPLPPLPIYLALRTHTPSEPLHPAQPVSCNMLRPPPHPVLSPLIAPAGQSR
jgi:hypothetical protein